MGKTYTPKYRAIIDGQMQSWSIKDHGKATDKNLEKYVMAYSESLKLGGANEHISKSLGYVPFPIWARIETNVNSFLIPIIKARWQSAKFQVF